MLSRWQDDGGSAYDRLATSLIDPLGLDIYAALSVFIHVFMCNLALEPHSIAQINELTILSIAALKPAFVTHPVGEQMCIPAVPLYAGVISIHRPYATRGRH